jgi:hypothetical protein
MIIFTVKKGVVKLFFDGLFEKTERVNLEGSWGFFSLPFGS